MDSGGRKQSTKRKNRPDYKTNTQLVDYLSKHLSEKRI